MILKSIIWVLSIPFRVFAKIFEYSNIDNINNDVSKCLQVIDKNLEINITGTFIDILILAEDRRNNVHYGIDPIAIIRAIKVRYTKKVYQGASTIEQQFVRVVTCRYEKTLYRKFREQILAILVSKKRKKYDISNAYLLIAYYGTKLNGLQETLKELNLCVALLSKDDIISIISRLKYPEPSIKTANWENNHAVRNEYIKLMLK